MSSDLVIKVKYGNTLRRFNASTVDLNMGALKEKILDLFKFNMDADITLTYIDGDNDVVTLVDDDDLSDAVGQQLNPLRLTVLLNTTNRPGRAVLGLLSGTSTPVKLPRVQTQSSFKINTGLEEALKYVPEQFQINTGLEDALKYVPDQFRSLLLKLASELITKAASSAPQELEHIFEFVGNHLVPLSQGPETAEAGVPVNDAKNQKAPDESSKNSEVVQNTNLLDQLLANNPKQNDGGKTNKDLWTSASLTAAAVDSVDLNPDLHRAPLQELVFPSKDDSNTCPTNRQMEGGDACDAKPPLGQAFPSDSVGRCSEIHDSMSHTFHSGIRCDGCGMHPIVGPRYKSNVQEDYDLCCICFSQIGNEVDYTRINRSSTYHSPQLFKELYNNHPQFHGPQHLSLRGYGVKQSREKLGSHFIQDVTILDGTLMPPNTPFTKIWRVHNNGTLPWPRQTQLLWIEGDQLGDKKSVELEIPENGCPVDSVLDIAVDLTSPAQPGRYISYWKMASPSGQKFGDCIWVLIHVDPYLSQEEPLSESYHAVLNLNLPPETSREKGKKKLQEIIDVNVEPVDGSRPETNYLPPVAVEPVEPLANPPSRSPVLVSMDSLINATIVEIGSVPEIVAPVDYPRTDFSPVHKDSSPMEESLLKELEEMGFKEIDLNKEILRMNEFNLEQSVDDLCGVSEWDPILEELEELGFCDEETNKKLLIKNGGSTKRTVFDLVAEKKIA